MSSTTAVRDDRLLAPTRWVSGAVVPVLGAAFVILYLFPGQTMRLWGWMICPHMPAFVMGGGYLAGAYFFIRASRARGWHRVGVGFAATTVFSTVLLAVTVLHWDVFNHGHVSFWAWLLLYVATPVLLPVLWANNRRTDPGLLDAGDVRIPRRLRTAVGIGGGLQLAFAATTFLWPEALARVWPWATDIATLRVLSAFIAFPAVTWLWFLFEDRWSSFRITQQTAVIGLTLVLLGALQSRTEFRSDARFSVYVALVGIALVLNVTLYVAMERQARRATAAPGAAAAVVAELPALVGSTSGGQR